MVVLEIAHGVLQLLAGRARNMAMPEAKVLFMLDQFYIFATTVFWFAGTNNNFSYHRRFGFASTDANFYNLLQQVF